MEHMRNNRTIIAFGALCWATAAWTTRAEVVDLTPSKDNTLYETLDGSRSNGIGKHMFIGTITRNERRRALVQFDLAGSVPEGSTINSVTLRVFMSRTVSGDFLATLHHVQSHWGEGESDAGEPGGLGAPSEPDDATWLHTFYDKDLWLNEGGDYEAAVHGSATIGAIGFYTFASTPEMVADAQAWLDDPVSNAGWIILGNEETSQTAKRLATREADDEAQQPKLTVDYTPPGGCIRDPEWRCDGDVDGNGAVNPVDSGLVQAAFCSPENCTPEELCQYDLDCNGAINPVDAGLVQSLFGTCNEPRSPCP
jgi:hypothetical protein